jgi:hypothetical protein
LATPEDRTNPDAESFHMHIAPLGDRKVSEFMKEDDKPQPQNNREDIQELGEYSAQISGRE